MRSNQWDTPVVLPAPMLVLGTFCQLYLSVARKLYPMSPPVYHILDLIQTAIGEQPALRHSERAGQMIRYMTFSLPRMVSPGRSWVEV
ncbi:MAG TPA: hypothetical protein VMX96_07615 [Dehalococcoidia bacterium]|nr:hypothetical protein [Dehalococcoidia bacterium]